MIVGDRVFTPDELIGHVISVDEVPMGPNGEYEEYAEVGFSSDDEASVWWPSVMLRLAPKLKLGVEGL